MSLNYTAHFKYEYSESALLPNEEPVGHGICQIDIERKPETTEEWREIAATIGRASQGAYKSVEILKLYETVAPAAATSADGTDEAPLEGVILD